MDDAHAEKLRMQAEAARRLVAAQSHNAYEGSKALLRAGHVAYQYVVLGACALVCFSSVQAFLSILTGATSTGRWFWGLLTQLYFFLFGAAGILLETPFFALAEPVLAFKLFVDRWLRALSRHTGRGFVYFSHAVLLIDAQHLFTKFGELSGYVLLFAGLFSLGIGYVDTADVMQLKEKIRDESSRNGRVATAQQVFREADADRSGALTRDEVERLVRRRHPSMTDRQAAFFFANLDTNQDQVVSLEEFMVWYDRNRFTADDAY